MLQALVKKGKVITENIPAPMITRGYIQIKVLYSCISAGTEVSSVQASGKTLIKRALEKPDNVKKALVMIKQAGFNRAIKNIKNKIDTGTPTGYSISGIVISVGEGINDIKIGDRVAAAGAGYANHAEIVIVPEKLVVKIPETLSHIDASTVTLGAIAMQGVRRADIRLGEFCVVFGSGILGLLSVQILKSSGARVIAIDLDENRLDIAKDFGAEITLNPTKEDIIKTIESLTGGYGADAVLFTAATTSSEPLSTSFKVCKKKGKVILVGVVGMIINREDIYQKELDFMISTSYGPGRYDKQYEENGYDYPYAYVRWTEKRNMEEYIRMLDIGLVKLEKLRTETFHINKANLAFEYLQVSESKPLMVFLEYDAMKSSLQNPYIEKLCLSTIPLKKNVINVGFVGVGGFATSMHLPNIAELQDKFKIFGIMNRTGYKAKALAEQFNASYATTDYEEIINDINIDLVFISTRHDSHADLVLRALNKGKNVFVEKPLATNKQELELIKAYYECTEDEKKPLLMVGFNRRFSRYIAEIKKHTDKRVNPVFIIYRMNAGYIPLEHWVHESGGRIIGEACHIIDLMNYLTNSKIASISYEFVSPQTSKFSDSDNRSIILKYSDGSVCAIQYFSCGNKQFPKEYMEVHFDEKTIVLDDYKLLKGYGLKIKELHTTNSEKGQKEELIALYESLVRTTKWPIEFWDLLQTTEISFNLADN